MRAVDCVGSLLALQIYGQKIHICNFFVENLMLIRSVSIVFAFLSVFWRVFIVGLGCFQFLFSVVACG